MYSLIHDLQYELKEMEWKLSFLADYCDFIVKLSRYHNFSIPTEQLIQDYPLDRFVDDLSGGEHKNFDDYEKAMRSLLGSAINKN